MLTLRCELLTATYLISHRLSREPREVSTIIIFHLQTRKLNREEKSIVQGQSARTWDYNPEDLPQTQVCVCGVVCRWFSDIGQDQNHSENLVENKKAQSRPILKGRGHLGSL